MKKEMDRIKARMAYAGSRTPQDASTPKKAMTCHRFFQKLLKVNLTPAQGVIIKVAVDRVPIAELTEEEQILAVEIFNLSSHTAIHPISMKIICLLLGRGSGKSLIVAGIALYLTLTLPLRGAGPGSIPIFVVIAPDKGSAIDITMQNVRTLIDNCPELRAFCADQKEEYVELRRPEGRLVRIVAAAADKGGRNVRGRDILGFILEEAQFFNSDPGGRYIVNDRDVYSAIVPRLMPGSIGFFVSTPWPSENLMAELMEKNFGKPESALCARASTSIMRPDNAEMLARIEQERLRDPDNARREFDCDSSAVMTGAFFDLSAIKRAMEHEFTFLDPHRFPVACAIDLAFKSDSSTLCVVQYDGHRFNMVHHEELRPKEGVPLKPSEVLGHFADVSKAFGCRYVISDGHYREAAREAFTAAGISLVDAPEGREGKLSTYLRAKAMLDEDRVGLPENRRIQLQCSLITSSPSSGGGVTIRTPRRVGMGHGDIVSAWVLALHHLSYAAVKFFPNTPKKGDPNYWEWRRQQYKIAEEKAEERYLKDAEKPKSWGRYS
jgi:hypothetical protein